MAGRAAAQRARRGHVRAAGTRQVAGPVARGRGLPGDLWVVFNRQGREHPAVAPAISRPAICRA